jgi:hypothetical protein
MGHRWVVLIAEAIGIVESFLFTLTSLINFKRKASGG